MSDAKTLATDSSSRKEKSRKEYIPEDPNSDPKFSESLSRNSDLSDDSNYKCRIRDKKKKCQKRKKQDPIKLCANLTSKLLTKLYKLKVLKLKLDKDPLQHRIYFLTFLESLEMVFHGTRKLARYL